MCTIKQLVQMDSQIAKKKRNKKIKKKKPIKKEMLKCLDSNLFLT